MLIVSSRMLRLAFQVAISGYLFYLVNEYVFGYEEEEVEPGADTAASSIALTVIQAEQGAEGAEALESDQADESLVQVPDKPPEGAIFIPLWWGKRSPPQFWKSSDPEWQAYLKFAKDEEKRKEITGKANEDILMLSELTLGPGLLYTHILGKMPIQWTKALGSPVRIDRTMLDFSYQGGPRPEYERLG